MALIHCPYCGKQVSDTVDSCVHCGAELVKLPQQSNILNRRIFSALSDNEQKELKQEFGRLMPEYSLEVKIRGALRYIIIGLSLVGLILAYFGLDANINNTTRYIVLIADILLVIALIVMVIIDVTSRKKAEKDELLYFKLFSLWLNARKNVEFTMSLTPKQQLIFDELIITDEDKRRIEND